MTRPRIAVIVGNQISGDSRVIKSAVSARRMGADVILIGTSPTSERQCSRLGDIVVVRVPAAPSGSGARKIVSRSDQGWAIRPLAPLAFRSTEQYGRSSDRRTERRARTRERIDGVKSAMRRDRGVGKVRHRIVLDVLRMRSLVLDAWFVLRRRAFVRSPIRVGRTPRQDSLQAFLEERLPFAAGFVEAMVPVLEEFEPDLIHAHDIFMAPVAATVAQRSRGRVRWIYDAHEWVAGLRVERAIPKTVAADELERRVAGTADAVMTVGEAMADELLSGLGLSSRPTVVLNAPPEMSSAAPEQRLRSAAGLAPDVPLLVYPGVVKPKRGLETVVEALPRLEGVHLAVMADLASPHVRDLRQRAADRGVDARLHLLPYVAPDQIAPFISDATAGIYPLTHYPNAEMALPTKLLEYAQARLPVVVSDTREMAEFVRRHGVGEVFVSEDPADFAVAAQAVIDDPDRYRAGYSDALVSGYTWEEQERHLQALYESLLGQALQQPVGPFSIPAESPTP
jgi:glycosyltransferase involved in cell wall biosynthesis